MTTTSQRARRAPKIILRASRCGHHFREDCTSCLSALECTDAEIDRLHAQIATLEDEAHARGKAEGYALAKAEDRAVAAATIAGIKCECGEPATTKYDGDDYCRKCAEACAWRDFEEGDMPGGFGEG